MDKVPKVGVAERPEGRFKNDMLEASAVTWYSITPDKLTEDSRHNEAKVGLNTKASGAWAISKSAVFTAKNGLFSALSIRRALVALVLGSTKV